MSKKVLLINIFLFLLIIEISSTIIIRSENYMYRFFGNTTEMWLTFWQNKTESTGDLYSSRYVYHNKLGWVLNSNLNDYFDNDSAYFMTTSNGIRSEEEYKYEKLQHVKRIAVIGDSYTEGAEVANHQTWPFFMEQNLGDSIEVLNFGVGGYGHDQCLIRLKEDVLKFNPDIVLLGFVNPDISRNVVAFRDFAKPMFLIEKEKLILKDTIIPPIESFKKKRFFKSKALVSLLFNNTQEKSYEYSENLTEEIVKTMQNLCKKNDIRFTCVFIPTPEEIDQNNKEFEMDRFIKEITRDYNIDFINTLPAFESKKIYKRNGHWDAAGNQIIGNYVSKQLK